MAEIARSRVGLATYLVPDGPLTGATRLQALRETVESCLSSNEVHLVIDFAGVSLVNSEALELLLDLQADLGGAGGELRITNANAVIEDVFRITRAGERIAFVNELSPEGSPTVQPRTSAGRKIGEILVEGGLVTEEQVDEALELQHRTGERMAQILVQKGWLPEKDLLQALSAQLGVPFVWLRQGVFDPAVTSVLSGTSHCV